MLETDAGSNRVVVGTPRASWPRRRVRIRGARLHRGAERVNAVRLRYHSATRRCRLELDPDREARRPIALAEPVEGVAPGQIACLMDGDLVVGHGTIA